MSYRNRGCDRTQATQTHHRQPRLPSPRYIDAQPVLSLRRLDVRLVRFGPTVAEHAAVAAGCR